MPQAADTVDLSEFLLIEALDVANLRAANPDSLAAPPYDSVRPLPFDSTLDSAMTAAPPKILYTPLTAEETVAVRADSWTEGLLPRPRFIHPASSNGFLLSLAVILIVAAFNIRNLAHVVSVSATELVKVRYGRDNIFMERSATDTRIRIFLLLIFAAAAGIFTATGVLAISGLGAALTMPVVVKYFALCSLYCIMMYFAYQTVGYTFAPGDGRREWVRGYTASLILGAVIIALPAVVSVFYPAFALELAAGALAVFVIGRILFIIKGFRIFYDKISDLVYFILYLCTLEIIPLMLVYRLAMMDLPFSF